MTQVLEEKNVGTKAWPWLAASLALTAASVACVWIPMQVIRPFHPQNADALSVALWIHEHGPLLAGVCAALVLVLTIWSWKRVSARNPKPGFRVMMVCLSVLSIVAACLTHINIFEKMFHPYDAPAFESADNAQVDGNDIDRKSVV